MVWLIRLFFSSFYFNALQSVERNKKDQTEKLLDAANLIGKSRTLTAGRILAIL